ncbi:S-layer homology domain-containing protein [Paenibacillus sp. DXFW5]|uniref:S-layer homology domain-containing protein n=1 Tax=Paenibacillus rhizolycopersici TaxID=2780073 RepID=A0ABS2HAC2_9BACL|nr:S-layer homology domain-containing protein [Paenibacillus rhizolycopersici]MBM6998337.1 S-layer homology domain-containing protein [Paenibacillus rhizolycopersici]
MQRFKKPIVWLALIALVVGLLPVGAASKAHAAPDNWAPPSYFIPDDVMLQSTVSLDPKSTDVKTKLSRENVQISNSADFPIDGSFKDVSSNLEVTVQQLNSTSTGWVPNATNVASTKLTDNGNNRFSVTLKLFPGYNKVTFSGTQGSTKRTDTFYILFDKVPTLINAQVYWPGGTGVNLNEDARAVVSTKRIMIRGTLSNATKVGVKVNGEESQWGTILDNGDFFTSYLTLKSGLNTLEIGVENETSKITATRLIYFFDENQPFVELNLYHDGSNIDLLSQKPIISKTPNEAGLSGQVLLPYKSETYASGGVATNPITVSVNGGTPSSLATTVTEEIVIPGADGITPAYRLVTFNTSGKFTFANTEDQDIEVTVKYGADPTKQYTGSHKASFKYLEGQKVIKSIHLLENYTGGDVSKATKKLISGSQNNIPQVSSSDFYILVESTEAIDDSNVLNGMYLPLSTNALNITAVDPQPAGVTANQVLYKIEGFASGTQQVRFYLDDSNAYYNGNITFVSRSSIRVNNLLNGQTIEIDSAATTTSTITITGEYTGFGDSTASGFSFYNQVVVNGTERFPNNQDTWLNQTTGQFSLTFNVANTGPLYYGQNTIVLSGKTSGTNPNIVTETLRFFIVDKNKSTIDKFIPVAAPSDPAQRVTFVEDIDSNNIDKIFQQATDFTPTDTGFITGRSSYDLVLHGGGAERIELYLGSELFFATDISSTSANNYKVGQPISEGKTGYVYDFAGTQQNFILRIRDIKFDSQVSMSHIYNMDLINRTGSRTSQKLEVQREVSAYRIIAPQPTVGGQIIVNKNFVRFDIEAEGATAVTIGKDTATKRTDLEANSISRFSYDYVGLKKDAWNTIKINIDRNGIKTSTDVRVYYASTVAIDSQFMAEKVSNKYSVFNKQLELTFPKGTVLQNALVPKNEVVKFYPDNKLLFGIADPSDGVVERRNDYGNVIFDPLSGEDSGYREIGKPDYEVSLFVAEDYNFTKVSDVYWISGGIGELENSPATNGLPPYSSWYSFPSKNSTDPVSYMLIDPTRRLVPSARGELTLAYNPNVVDAAGTTLTVFRLTETGEWENIGGEVDTKNHTITVPFDKFGYYKVMKMKSSFKDITDHRWARDILNGLYAKGIMKDNGLRSGLFGTDDEIKRGEFATLLVKGLNLPLNYDDNQTFFEVGPGAKTNTWSYEYIETAARAGIVTGLGDGYFGVNESLTREQAAVMIARALKLKTAINDSKLEATLAKTFLDSSKIDIYARPAVQAVYKAKIMSGNPVTVPGQKKSSYNFNPDSPMTRAEAGKIAVELLKKSTSIFPKNFG